MVKEEKEKRESLLRGQIVLHAVSAEGLSGSEVLWLLEGGFVSAEDGDAGSRTGSQFGDVWSPGKIGTEGETERFQGRDRDLG